MNNGFELMVELAKLKAEGNAPEEVEVSEEEFNSIKYFDVGTTSICGIPVRVTGESDGYNAS